MHCWVSALSCARSPKTICLKISAYSFAWFLYCNEKNLRLAPFLQVKVSVVSSAGDSFCWNYATDTLWQLCKWQRLLHFCRFWGGTFCYWYVGGFLLNYAGNSFCHNYAVRGFCSTYVGNSFCNKYVYDNFYCNYADETLWYNYAGGIFLHCIMHMTVSGNNFIFRSLTDSLSS